MHTRTRVIWIQPDKRWCPEDIDAVSLHSACSTRSDLRSVLLILPRGGHYRILFQTASLHLSSRNFVVDMGSQRNNEMSTMQGQFDHAAQTESPLLQRYDDEHGNEMDQSIPSVEHAQGHLDSAFNDERQRFQLAEKRVPNISTSAQDHVLPPCQCRRVMALPTIRQIALDTCITIVSLYFLAFAFLVFSHRGELATSRVATHLLDAARLVSYP
jgi:hypothetical protein